MIRSQSSDGGFDGFSPTRDAFDAPGLAETLNGASPAEFWSKVFVDPSVSPILIQAIENGAACDEEQE